MDIVVGIVGFAGGRCDAVGQVGGYSAGRVLLECLALMMQSFITNQIPSLLHLPSYDDWFFTQDETVSYRRLADNLRLIGFAEPEKTWLLKNPTDLMRMETLLTVFPDARVIHTHRDPVPTFGSLCSMLGAYRGNPAPGSSEARVIGPRQLRFYKAAIEHTMAVRERRPDDFHDVFQPALRA
ncbi:MAG: sulfotransferase, partial [Kiritimatiellia bacterium]|nr:sulfotransferase [Kiritimatiellia bacterium]